MRSRRALLSTIGTCAVAGCTRSDGPLPREDPADRPCTDLESDEDLPDRDLADLRVTNDGAEATTVDVAVDDPDERRCATFELRAGADRTCRKLFEGGDQHTVTVEVGTENPIVNARTFVYETYTHVGVTVDVTETEVEIQIVGA